MDKTTEEFSGCSNVQQLHRQPVTSKPRPTMLVQRADSARYSLQDEQHMRPQQRQTSLRRLLSFVEETEELVSKGPKPSVTQPPPSLASKRRCFGRSQSLRLLVGSNDNNIAAADTDGPSLRRQSSSRFHETDCSKNSFSLQEQDETESSNGDPSSHFSVDSDQSTDLKPRRQSNTTEDKISAFRRLIVRKSHSYDFDSCGLGDGGSSRGGSSPLGDGDRPTRIKTTQTSCLHNRNITSEKRIGNASSSTDKDAGGRPKTLRGALTRSMSSRFNFGDDTVATILPKPQEEKSRNVGPLGSGHSASSRFIIADESERTTMTTESALLPPPKPLTEEKSTRGLRSALSRTRSCRLNYVDETEPAGVIRETTLPPKPVVEDKQSTGLQGVLSRTRSCCLNLVDEEEPTTATAVDAATVALPQKPLTSAVRPTRSMRSALTRSGSCRLTFGVDDEPEATTTGAIPVALQKRLAEQKPSRSMRLALSRSLSCRSNFAVEEDETETTATRREPIALQKRMEGMEKATQGNFRSAMIRSRSSRTSFKGQDEEAANATEATVDISEESNVTIVTADAPSTISATAARISDFRADVTNDNEASKIDLCKEKYSKQAMAAVCRSTWSALGVIVVALCQNTVARAAAGGTFDLLLYVAGKALMCACWLLGITADSIRVVSVWLINQPVVRNALIAAYSGGKTTSSGNGKKRV